MNNIISFKKIKYEFVDRRGLRKTIFCRFQYSRSQSLNRIASLKTLDFSFRDNFKRFNYRLVNHFQPLLLQFPRWNLILLKMQLTSVLKVVRMKIGYDNEGKCVGLVKLTTRDFSLIQSEAKWLRAIAAQCRDNKREMTPIISTLDFELSNIQGVPNERQE